MKVYVSELPKSCNECPCMNEDYERGCWCNIETSLDIQTDYDKETFTSKCHRQRHEECPLQSLSDHDKQVCEKIRKFVIDRRTEIKYNFTDYAKGRDSAFFEIKELLDQIQGD